MARAKRTRDYRAEEARRNQLAKSRGFTSRAQQRRALRTGAWVPVRKSDKPRAPIVYTASPTPPPTLTRKPGSSNLARLRRESQEWSSKHSRVDASKYDPRFPPERVRKYHAAFVDDATRAYRIENGLYSLRDYLVDELGYYTDAEFDDRYRITF